MPGKRPSRSRAPQNASVGATLGGRQCGAEEDDDEGAQGGRRCGRAARSPMLSARFWIADDLYYKDHPPLPTSDLSGSCARACRGERPRARVRKVLVLPPTQLYVELDRDLSDSAQLPAAARLHHWSTRNDRGALKAHLSAPPQRGGTRQCGVEYLSTAHCRVPPARRGRQVPTLDPCRSAARGAPRRGRRPLFI